MFLHESLFRKHLVNRGQIILRIEHCDGQTPPSEKKEMETLESFREMAGNLLGACFFWLLVLTHIVLTVFRFVSSIV